jgi:CBS domain-containing protein
MVSPVVTVKPNATIKEVATLLRKHQISAVPVVDDRDTLVGMVSEGDLIRRAEIGTEKHGSWWLLLLGDDNALAVSYIKAHAKHVADVMSRKVLTAAPDTPLHEIAAILEKNRIKRVPITRNGRIVGIVSRANLVQALASSGSKLDIPISDSALRERILKHLSEQGWIHTALVNVTVNGGVVDLWGITSSESERKVIRVAAEGTPGVRAVNDHMFVRGSMALL